MVLVIIVFVIKFHNFTTMHFLQVL